MVAKKITYLVGLPEACRPYVAALADAAFAYAFQMTIPSQRDRIAMWSERIQLDRVAGAFIGNQLVGYAGFTQGGRSYVGQISPGFFLERQNLLLGGFNALNYGMMNVALGVHEATKSIIGEESLYINGLSVAPSKRNKGIGTSLLKLMFGYAREHQYDRVRLMVVNKNRRARALYERLGFKPIHPFDIPLNDFIRIPDLGQEMEKELARPTV